MFCIECTKKLNGDDEFASEIGYTTEYIGDVGCNVTKCFPMFSS